MKERECVTIATFLSRYLLHLDTAFHRTACVLKNNLTFGYKMKMSLKVRPRQNWKHFQNDSTGLKTVKTHYSILLEDLNVVLQSASRNVESYCLLEPTAEILKLT